MLIKKWNLVMGSLLWICQIYSFIPLRNILNNGILNILNNTSEIYLPKSLSIKKSLDNTIHLQITSRLNHSPKRGEKSLHLLNKEKRLCIALCDVIWNYSALVHVLSITLESVLCECFDGELDPLEELCAKKFILLNFLEKELINLRELDFCMSLLIQTCSFSRSFNLIRSRASSSFSSRFSRLSDA